MKGIRTFWPFSLKFPSASFSMAASLTSQMKSQVRVSGSS